MPRIKDVIANLDALQALEFEEEKFDEDFMIREVSSDEMRRSLLSAEGEPDYSEFFRRYYGRKEQ